MVGGEENTFKECMHQIKWPEKDDKEMYIVKMALDPAKRKIFVDSCVHMLDR